MRVQVTRNEKNIHKVMVQHVGHDLELTKHENHTFLWCNTCSGAGQFVDVQQKFVVMKTYDDGVQNPVLFLFSEDPKAPRNIDAGI